MEKIRKVFIGEIKEVNEADKTIVAHVSTKTRDRHDEVVDPEGLDLKQFKKNPVVLWAHDYWSPPIGKALWIKQDEKGIIAKTQFAPDEFSQRIFELFKGGFMKAFSIGFMPKEWTDGDGNKTARRTYTKSELLEYSPVPVPANPDALALALEKGIITKDMKETLERRAVAPGAPKEPETEDEKKAAKEKAAAEKKKEEEQKTSTDEMIAEIEQKDAEIKALGEELVKVRYDLYMSLKNPRDKAVSEIAGKDLIKTINEGIAGAIRDVTGKVS